MTRGLLSLCLTQKKSEILKTATSPPPTPDGTGPPPPRSVCLFPSLAPSTKFLMPARESPSRTSDQSVRHRCQGTRLREKRGGGGGRPKVKTGPHILGKGTQGGERADCRYTIHSSSRHSSKKSSQFRAGETRNLHLQKKPMHAGRFFAYYYGSSTLRVLVPPSKLETTTTTTIEWG